MLVRENISDFLKPKSEQELGDRYREMVQKTADFMTKIFSDLHKDPNDPNIYRNSNDVWVFEHDLKSGYIWVNYYRVWLYSENNIICNYNIIKMLIEGWLKENTDWPHYDIDWKIKI